MRRTLSIGCVLGTLAGGGVGAETMSSEARAEETPSKIVRTSEAPGDAQRRTTQGAARPQLPTRALAFQPKIRSSVMPSDPAPIDSGGPIDAPAALGNRFDDAFGMFGGPAPVREPKVELASYEAPVAGDALGYAAEPAPSHAGAILAPPKTAPLAQPIAAAERVLPMPQAKPRVPKAPIQLASLEPSAATAVSPPAAAPAQPSPALAVAPVLGDEPRKMPKAALPYIDIIRREARKNAVPVWLAVGVAWVESKFDPKLRGSHGVVGLMQVMPSTARYQGYRGETAKLFDAETNIVWGTKELGWDYAKANGDICLTIAKYKGGIATRHVNAGAQRYCDQVYMITGMGNAPNYLNRVAAEKPKAGPSKAAAAKARKKTAEAEAQLPPGVQVR